MTKKKYLITYSCVSVLVFGSVMFMPEYSHSRSSGAPAGKTNSPADASVCTACHTNGPAASPITSIISSDIPVEGYTPGNTYNFTASYSRPGHIRYGFEISPQTLSGSLVGTLINSSQTKFADNNVKYVTHTSSSNTFSSGTASWNFQWTAPVAGTGDVTFYGALNVTNNSQSNQGDTIHYYTQTYSENLSSGLVKGTINGKDVFKASLSDNFLNINLFNFYKFPAQINVYDLTGKRLGHLQIDEDSPEKLQVTLTGYKAGLLIVHLMDDDGVIYTQKIIE